MLVAADLLPAAWATGPRGRVTAGCLVGALAMVAIAALLQV